MTAARPVIVWFRQDLRVDDNPALCAAIRTGAPVIALFILDDATNGVRPMGAASRWWLDGSLRALDADLRQRGCALTLRRGASAEALEAVIAETTAQAVFWNRLYDGGAVARDTAIKASLAARGVAAHSSNAGLLHEPWTVKTGAGEPYKVFSPFWRACLRTGEPEAPSPPPTSKIDAAPQIASDDLDAWRLTPTAPDWAGGLRAEWTPGEAGAQARLAQFLETALTGYPEDRNRPDFESTSRLSPHLHFGEIGPRRIWRSVEDAVAGGASRKAADKFLSEIGWREFSHNLLFHFPSMETDNLRPEFDAFPWSDDDDACRAWSRGLTGYPVVDAGMRQLWSSGWMHNRVRMIAASFLIKDLLVDWRRGEAWFWDTLTDADIANNVASWQWTAGCGADAAPYFRVFNPVTQGRKFDPDGAYVRRWVPELADLSADDIHAPWEVAPDVLARAGVRLGVDYPRPIVDHGAARLRALDAFAKIKKDAA